MGSKRSPPPKGLRKPANAPSIGKPGGAKPPILAASLTTSLIPAKSRLELHKLILPCTPRVPIFCQLSPFHAAIVEKFKGPWTHGSQPFALPGTTLPAYLNAEPTALPQQLVLILTQKGANQASLTLWPLAESS